MNYTLLFIGVLDLVISVSLLNKKVVEKYVKYSPKAWIWRKIFGEEKAVKVLKNIFAPIGIIFGIFIIILSFLK